MNDSEIKQYPVPKQEYKVLVICSTFNHSKYIEETLNGFAMQQTNFPFVCLVMDDASTDGEQDILKAWMERECDMNSAETIDITTSIVIIVPHKTNPSCTFAFYLLKQNLYGTGKKIYYLNPWREKCEYEALCEGDDYWIDPLKLQKQVDFMEENLEYGLIYTRTKHLYENHFFVDEPIMSECDTISLLDKNPIRTLSVLYRTTLYKEFFDFTKTELQHSYDLPIFLWFSHYSRIKYIPDITGVYRVLTNSASHSDDASKIYKFEERCLEVRKYWCSRINVDFEKYEYSHLRKCYYYALKKCDIEGLCIYRKALRFFYTEHNIPLFRRIFLIYIGDLDIILSRSIQFILPIYRNVRTFYRRLK